MRKVSCENRGLFDTEEVRIQYRNERVPQGCFLKVKMFEFDL
jgi:hypothetical protein